MKAQTYPLRLLILMLSVNIIFISPDSIDNLLLLFNKLDCPSEIADIETGNDSF